MVLARARRRWEVLGGFVVRVIGIGCGGGGSGGADGSMVSSGVGSALRMSDEVFVASDHLVPGEGIAKRITDASRARAGEGPGAARAWRPHLREGEAVVVRF